MVDQKLVATIVSSRIVGIRHRNEMKTTSSHERATLCKNQEDERMKGKGGGRQRLKHVDGDVPLCMRSKDEGRESKPKQMEKCSSSNASGEGSRKKEIRKGAENGSKNPCSSSTEKKKTMRETLEEKDVTFVVLQKTEVAELK